MPIRLPSNRPADRFYRGGAGIARFRGEGPTAPHEPEDWIASTTTVAGEGPVGLTRLPDGRLLRDAIAEDPSAWLGSEHASRWGADPQLLVKLLDAGQRLPVHAHPHDDFAAAHLGRAHGKAEAWYILTGGTVHIGLRTALTTAALRRLVDDQDPAALLALLHEVDVAPGDVVWVPPGELHAIGAGVFLLELQQPEDLSILLEWRDFRIDGARSGHLGVGYDRALEAVTRTPRSEPELEALVRRAPSAAALLPSAAAAYFRLDRFETPGMRVAPAGFAVGVTVRGAPIVGGERMPAGSTFVVAAAEGPVSIGGDGELLWARPPRP